MNLITTNNCVAYEAEQLSERKFLVGLSGICPGFSSLGLSLSIVCMVRVKRGRIRIKFGILLNS